MKYYYLIPNKYKTKSKLVYRFGISDKEYTVHFRKSLTSNWILSSFQEDTIEGMRRSWIMLKESCNAGTKEQAETYYQK